MIRGPGARRQAKRHRGSHDSHRGTANTTGHRAVCRPRHATQLTPQPPSLRSLGLRGVQDLDGIAGPDHATGVWDQVLAEDELLSEAPALAEHLKRLPAAFAGDLVGGGDDAPPARLGHPERYRADADAEPAVFGPRRAPATTTLGRNRVIGTGVSPSAASV